jgi:TRAF3-interacting protein 1
MFEQLFDKPKMTQMLLKPPFRYLHDIFVATMQATGFGNGLYEEVELDTKANHDKDAKISILAKMITLTARRLWNPTSRTLAVPQHECRRVHTTIFIY